MKFGPIIAVALALVMAGCSTSPLSKKADKEFRVYTDYLKQIEGTSR